MVTAAEGKRAHMIIVRDERRPNSNGHCSTWI